MPEQTSIFAAQAGFGYYPQNSLAAADFCTAQLGVAGIEVTLQWTADKQLVCHQHQRLDPALTRYAAGRWLTPLEQWPLSQLTLAELAELRLGELNPELEGIVKPPRQLAVAQPVATLAQMMKQLRQRSAPPQLLMHLPSALINTDIDIDFVNAVLAEIAAHSSELQCIITSYDWRILQFVQQRQPTQRCWYRLHPPAWYQPEWGDAAAVIDQEQQALIVQQAWQQQQLPWLAGAQPGSYPALIQLAQASGSPLYCHLSALPYISNPEQVVFWTEQQQQPLVYQQLQQLNALALVTDSPYCYSHQASAACNELVAFGKQCFEKKQWQPLVERYQPIVSAQQGRCHFEIIYRLAIALRRLQRFAESEQVLLQGLQVYPNQHNLYIELAALENQRENWSVALDHWYQAFHIAEGFSVMSYQRLTKAIIMSCEQRPWFAKAFYQASTTAHQDKYFSAYFAYFLITQVSSPAELPQAITKLAALQASNYLYQYGVPHLYQLQSMRLRLALAQQPGLNRQPANWNELLKSDKPSRLMPQDLASLNSLLSALAAGEQPQLPAAFYAALQLALQPLSAIAQRALTNLCTKDAFNQPQVIASVTAIQALLSQPLQAAWLPEQAWLILSNILLLRFQIADAYQLRGLALRCHNLALQQQGLSSLQLEPEHDRPLAWQMLSEPGQRQQQALALLVNGQPAAFLDEFSYLRSPAFAAAIAGKTIALVGPVDVGLEQGVLIDQHDIVIRLNFRLPGYWQPQRAGSRTDISYYANDLIKGADTASSLLQGMQQLAWVVFDTKTELPPGVLPARHRCQLPYRDCNPVYKGYVNAIQKVILDLLLHQPAAITVFNTNLWLSDSSISGYHTGHQRNEVSRFIWHDPASNFRFLQRCLQHGYISADPVLSQILQLSEQAYIEQLDAVIQIQENT